jgi:hypothetical protein
MAKCYFTCWVRLDGVNLYLIWFSNGGEGVLIDSSKRIRAFDSPESVEVFAANSGFSLQESERLEHNLDAISLWLSSCSAEEIDCRQFLDAWNLFTDVSSSLGIAFDVNQDDSISAYDELFRGSNLPSMEGNLQPFPYEPVWSDHDVEVLCRVLREGLDIFANNLSITSLPKNSPSGP